MLSKLFLCNCETRTKVVHKNVSQGCNKVRRSFNRTNHKTSQKHKSDIYEKIVPS